MRVFLDTNVLVAAFATRGLCEDVLRIIMCRAASSFATRTPKRHDDLVHLRADPLLRIAAQCCDNRVRRVAVWAPLTGHQLVVGETVLEELERILVKKLRMPPPKAKAVSGFVRDQAEVIRPAAPASWPEDDPDDQWITAAAVQGNVDVLVTGDHDLLDLAAEAPMLVVSPRGFWEKLR